MRLFISFVVRTSDPYDSNVFENMVMDTMVPPRSLERIRDMEGQILTCLKAEGRRLEGRVTILYFQPI